MASTEEVLKALQNAKITTLAATEPEELVIDAESRTITVPSSERLFGVTGDMNIERKYFRCPKIVGDNVDLSAHQIFIAYVYTETESGSIFPSIGVAPYHCEDVEVDGEDITFSWKLTGNVFKNPGFILFKMYAKRTETDPNTVFNTTPAIGTVLATIPDGTEEIVEEHPDVIAQIFDRLDALESGGGGGTGGTTNYEDLSNKPQLNGVTLEGNKTLDQVGVLAKNQGSNNSGKFLSVGRDGNVVPADAPSGGTVDPEQIKQAVNGYLEENPVSGMTAEQEEQLQQNTTDVADLKSAINEKWTDISPGEIFEISTNGNDNVYKLEGLAAYFDFTKYSDGYSGDVEDLSGNNTEIVISGLDLYESGRNGFVNGKLMINSGSLSNPAGSRMSIKSEAIHMYPFSIEIYVHLRRDYNPYAGNNVLTYENTGALPNYKCTLFSTQYNSSDGTGGTNGVKAMVNKENVAIQGSAFSPNVSKNVQGLEIDGIQNENIGDRYDHIVVCFDSNKQKFYLNNELIIDNDEKSTSLSMSSVLRILPEQLKGDIKLIRIYNDMFSDNDVEMNYSNALGDIENEI